MAESEENTSRDSNTGTGLPQARTAGRLRRRFTAPGTGLRRGRRASPPPRPARSADELSQERLTGFLLR